MAVELIRSRCSLEEQRKCGIYIIRNDVDSRVYIGKTGDTFRNRWSKHLDIMINPETHPQEASRPLYQFVQSIGGYTHISFDILEYIDQDQPIDYFLQREHYWTKHYNAYQEEHGFNREQIRCWNKTDTACIPDIILAIKCGIPYVDISNKYGISIRMIASIRKGESHRQDNEEYPIPFIMKDAIQRAKIIGILEAAKTQQYTFADLKEQFNVGRNTLRAILTGSSKQIPQDLLDKYDFPLGTVQFVYIQVDEGDNSSNKRRKCATYRKVLEKPISKCPTREKLKNDIREIPNFVEIGRLYGVCDNSIVKWCRRYHLPDSPTLIKRISDDEWEYACKHWDEVKHKYGKKLNVSPLSEEEKITINKMYDEQITIKEIAKHIGRSEDCVHDYLTRIGLPTSYIDRHQTPIYCPQLQITANSARAMAEEVMATYKWIETKNIQTVAHRVRDVLQGKKRGYCGLTFVYVTDD